MDSATQFVPITAGSVCPLDQLTAGTGSSKSYIWELENKNPPRPSAEKLSAIAGALGITVDYLLGSDSQSLGDAQDQAFFREYSGMSQDTKRQLREIAKTRTGILRPAGAWFREPVLEMCMRSDRYDREITLLHLEGLGPRHQDDEAVEDIYDRFAL